MQKNKEKSKSYPWKLNVKSKEVNQLSSSINLCLPYILTLKANTHSNNVPMNLQLELWIKLQDGIHVQSY